MSKTKNANRNSAFSHNLRTLAALACNLLPLCLVLWAIALHPAEQKTLLILGGIFAILGIASTVVSHTVLYDHAVSSLFSISLFGVSKGFCCTVILIHFFGAQSGADFLLLPLIGVLGIGLLFSLILALPRMEELRGWLFLLPLAILIASIVLLCVFPSPRTLFSLFFSLTLLFCFGARLIEFDGKRELRFNLCMASMLYAIGVLLVALSLVAGDGCDDCGCDSCDCDCGGGKGKKGKK